MQISPCLSESFPPGPGLLIMFEKALHFLSERKHAPLTASRLMLPAIWRRPSPSERHFRISHSGLEASLHEQRVVPRVNSIFNTCIADHPAVSTENANRSELAERIVYETKSLPSHHLTLSFIYITTNTANETFEMLQCNPFSSLRYRHAFGNGLLTYSFQTDLESM